MNGLIRHLIILVMLFATGNLLAQQITTAEYFWDTDPGQGNGTAMTAYDGNFDEAFEAILANGVSLPGTTGAHTFNIRVKDGNNNWGPVFKVVLDVQALGSTVRDVKVTQAEYFWDTDPGQGNGTAMLAFDGNFDEAFEAIVASGANFPGTVGVHTLNIRVRDVAGNWGPVFKVVLDVNAASLATLRTIQISAAEYFWDTDPGQGNGTAMLAFDGNFDEAFEALTQTVAPPVALGPHKLGVRVRDGANNWGPVFSVVIDVEASIFTLRDVKVAQAEAFWGTDPGQGNGTTVLAFDGNFNSAVEALAQNLALPGGVGARKLSLRVKDVVGNWGPVFSVVIDVQDAITTVRDVKVTAGEYFFNTDPGPGNATPMLAFDGNFDEAFEPIMGGSIPAPVTAGVNVLGIRVKDVAGNWGPVFKVVVNVDTTILGYVANINGPSSLCANDNLSAVNYTAASASGANFTWTAQGGVIVSGGSSPSATVNWNGSAPYELYLEVCDPNTLQCDTDTLVFTVKPISNSSRSQSICQGQSVVIGGIVRTTAGVFTDTLTAANGCDSLVAVTLTVKPNATSTVNQTICFGQTYLGYGTSGVYVDHYTAANGCDSARTLNLTVRPQNITTVTTSICQGQSYAGHTTTGTYNDTYTGFNGCDSTRTLNLTVTAHITNTVNHTACFGSSYLGYTSTGTYRDTFASSAGCDSIRTLNLTVLAANATSITQSICQGQTYAGYNSTGVYTDTYTNYRGCDSTRTLNLTVVQNVATTVNQTVCYGQTYLGYAATGTYRDTFPSAGGCDSVRTLNLTVRPQNTTTVNQSICPGQSYAGYTVAGTYTDTYTDRFGCDSTRTLNLSIGAFAQSTVDTAICFGQTYLGYAATGTYADTFAAFNGCDSIRTLNLTVRSQNAQTVTQTICQGQTYEGYSATGTYTDTLTDVNGCDSVRTLNLTVAAVLTTNVNEAICPGDSILLTGSYQTAAGTYRDTLSSSAGCDSVVTTVLTVYPQTNAPNIVRNGNVLSVSTGYAGYQWYQDGSPVANATSASLAIISNAEYFVVITDVNGCLVSSDTLDITNVGITGLTADFNWQAYPNPTDGTLFIEVSGLQNFSLELYNALGQKLHEVDLKAPQPYSVDMTTYAAGIYYVKLKAGSSVEIRKVLLSR